VHCVAPFACEQGEVRSEFSRFYFGIWISVTDGGFFYIFEKGSQLL
jgi:hypothetical protein